MRRQNKTVGLTVIGFLIGASTAWATTYSWTMQTIGQQGTYGDMISLTMARNQTWPSVFYYNSTLQVASSTPVGWTSASLGSLDGMYNQPPLRTTARSDGGMAAVWRTPVGYTLAQSSKTGWQSTSFTSSYRTSNPDLAYTSDNRPVVAYGNDNRIKVAGFDGSNWATEEVSITGQGPVSASRLSMGIDSLDRVSLAYSTGSGIEFAMKDPVGGTWSKYAPPSGASNPLYNLSDVQNISLAFGPNDETAMLVSNYNGLTYAWFDVRSGLWKTEVAASSVGSRFSELVFDNTGAPAFAYIDNGGSQYNVHYRRRVGLGWQDVVLPAHAYANSGVSLAFDYENLPVIAFRSDAGSSYGLTLAYDPIEVPEPATVALLSLALLFVRRRGN